MTSQTISRKQFLPFLCSAFLTTCASTALAEWLGWVHYSGDLPAWQMANCRISPITAPQHLCIADGSYIKFWSGNDSPCGPGEELGSGANCSAPPASDSNGGQDCGGQTPWPVTIATGSKYQSRIDYQGSGDFPISFGFYFNSLNTVGNQYFNSHWTHDYSRALSVSVNPITGDWGNLSDRWVLAKRDDGASFIYIQSASGVYRDRDGANTAYLEEFPGTGNDHWKLTFPGSSEEYYNQQGQLTRIVDLNTGLEQTLAYASNQVTVTHTNGESLTITYNAPPATGTYNNFQTTTFAAPPTSVTTPMGQYSYAYNPAGTRLEAVTFTPADQSYPALTVRQYLYEDPNHPLFYTKELDARDSVVSSVTYYPDGKVASSQKGTEGEIHTFDYPNDATRKVTNSFGLSTTYTIQLAPPHNLIKVRGAGTSTCQATQTDFTYDSKHRKIGATNGYDSHRGIIYEYNDDDRVTRVTEGGRVNGITPTYTNAEARSKGFTYYPDGKIESITQYYRDGGSSTSNWVGWVKEDYTYWPNHRVASIVATDLSDLTTPFGATNGQTRTTTYAYTYHSGEGIPVDTLVETLIIDGPLPGNSDTTTLVYDQQSRLLQQTNAVGQSVQYRDFTGAGLPQTIEDSNGVITQIGYHPLGWIETVTVKDPAGNTSQDATTEYEWYPNGTLEKVTYPDGAYLQYEYNDARHVVHVTNNLGERTDYAPNALGDWTRSETKDSSGNIHRLQRRIFDDLGRLRELLGNNSQRTLIYYDVKDNPTSIQEKGAFTATTTNYYDSLSRVNRVLQPRRTEVNGQLTSINHNTYYTYNIQDRVTSVTDPKGNTTTYVYNGFGEKITQISPDTGTTHYWYNEQGNLTFKQDARNVTVQYHYDDLGRLTWIQYLNSVEDVHYYYDEVDANNPYALGKLTRITDQTGSIAYQYDHRGNLTQDTRVIAGQTYSTGYGYNLADKLTQLTYPSGRIVHYYRNDALGRISAVTTQRTASDPEQSVVSGIQYLPFGPIQQYTYGNGLVRQVPYDLDYRIDQIQVSDTQSVLDLDYGYDAFNNITSILDNLNSSDSQTFTYDDLHRLQHAYGNYGTNTDHIRYEYDPVGNRTLKALSLGTATHTTETYAYDPLSNQLNTVTLDTGGGQAVRSLIYNDAGALDSETTFSGQSRSYAYNDNLRLIELNENSNTIGSYQLNALGQRISKTTDTGTEVFHYSSQGLQLASTDSQGNLLQEHLYLGSEPIAVVVADPVSSTPTNQVDLSSTSAFTSQDSSSGSVESSANSITLTGNRWRYVDGAVFTLSADAVLEFDMVADGLGEIQGIGFDTDHSASGAAVFKLSGTQNWGNQTYSYTGGGSVQHIVIPVGQHYTGENLQLLIVNDKDSGPSTSTLTISNVTVCESNCGGAAQ